jgi:hypothetical protein
MERHGDEALSLRRSERALSLRLGVLCGPSLAELDGLKVRALRALPTSLPQPPPRQLYVTEWRTALVSHAGAATVLVLGATEVNLPRSQQKAPHRIASYSRAAHFGRRSCMHLLCAAAVVKRRRFPRSGWRSRWSSVCYPCRHLPCGCSHETQCDRLARRVVRTPACGGSLARRGQRQVRVSLCAASTHRWRWRAREACRSMSPRPFYGRRDAGSPG